MKHGLVEVFEEFGTGILTVDGKILAYLSEKGPSRVKEVMVEVDTSYRGFYLATARLKEAGLVRTEVDPADKRARVLILNGSRQI